MEKPAMEVLKRADQNLLLHQSCSKIQLCHISRHDPTVTLDPLTKFTIASSKASQQPG